MSTAEMDGSGELAGQRSELFSRELAAQKISVTNLIPLFSRSN